MERHYDRAYRQGDVLLIPVTLTADEERELRVIPDMDGNPARGFRHVGERGDHAHVMERAVPLGTPQGVALLRIDAVTEALRHIALRGDPGDVHRTLAVPAGYYEPRIQRTWSPQRYWRDAD